MNWPKDIQDDSFPDGNFTVQANDTVLWTNQGLHNHTVTANGTFDSSPNCPPGDCMQTNDTFVWTFSEVGTFEYACKVHQNMTGTVTVLQEFNETPPA